MSPIPITQSEQLLENELVAQLIGEGYTKVAVTDEASMLANLKAQLEAFNGLTLTANLGERTKIANFPTSLDREIESVARQITHTQTFKKGLLQQTFF